MPKAPDLPPAEFDVSLLKQEYFHGLLPREDTALLLTKHGDFLIRLSEADTMGARLETVLSIMHDPKFRCRGSNPDPRLDYITHVIVQMVKKKFFITSSHASGSVPELISFYMKHTFEYKSQQLQLNRGIGLASWEFRAENVQLEQLVGKFSCGEVRKGKLIRKDAPPLPAVIKTVAGRSQDAKDKVKELLAQCRIMNDLYHPCVVQYYGVCLIAQPNCFMFEYVSYGPLDEFLRTHRDLKQDEMILMTMSVGWGLEYLHQNSILHRNLAAKKCLYDRQFVKLSGFGTARKTGTYTMKTPKKANIRWMAPESVQSFRFTQKSDVYAYGLLIYEIFAVKEPYEGLSNEEARQLILDGVTPEFTGRMLKNLADVITEKMWKMDPGNRATIRQIMAWMQLYTGMELQIVGGATSVTATVRQKMDNLLSKDVELQSLPNFKEPGPATPQRSSKKKKKN